jgi:hypothetical protein
MTIEPEVDLETAVEYNEPPPTLTTPFATVYVHVMPSTVSVAAWSVVAAINKREIVIAFLIVITFPTSSQNPAVSSKPPYQLA